MEKKIKQLSENFVRYVDLCNNDYRPYDASAYLYLLLLDKYIKGKGLEKAFNEADFFELLYATLYSWDMNTRGAKLKGFKDFKSALLVNKEDILKLQNCKIDEITENQINKGIFPILERLFKNLKTAKNETQIVSLSKTLHFMLPYLIMPIDRRYTMSYLYGHNNYSNNWESEFKTFKEVFYFFYEVAKRSNLDNKNLPHGRLNTSVPKVVDNAIIGYKKYQDKIKQ